MKAPTCHFLSILSLFLLSLTDSAKADLWPQFRGPLGNGVSTAENLPAELGENKNLVWKTPLPGRGWSSPVFDGKHVWISTAIEVFPTEEERLAKLKADGEEEKTFKARQVAKHIDLAILQVDFASGEIVQEIPLRSVENPQTIHSLNSFASPTPVLANGKLFAHFGTFGTYCIDTASGEVVWNRTIELEHGVGPGSSPFVWENLLILICDGVDRQFVTALQTETGETAWLKDRPEMRAAKGDTKKSYNTPLLVEGRDGKEQLICMGAQWLISYNPRTGDEIWRLDHGSGFSVVPRPVFSPQHQLLYISTGFGKPKLLAIRIDGEGDITDQGKITWEEAKRIPAKPSPLLVGDELYVIADGGVATCFDAGTGKVHWTERIDGNYSASPLFADGKIFVANQEGVVTAFSPTTSFSPIASNQLEASFMASPIAFDDSLILRSDTALYRFSK